MQQFLIPDKEGKKVVIKITKAFANKSFIARLVAALVPNEARFVQLGSSKIGALQLVQLGRSN